MVVSAIAVFGMVDNLMPSRLQIIHRPYYKLKPFLQTQTVTPGLSGLQDDRLRLELEHQRVYHQKLLAEYESRERRIREEVDERVGCSTNNLGLFF